MKTNSKIKILAASDIHGDSSLAKKLALKAEKEKVDLVILCGDLTIQDNLMQGIISPFTKKNKKVILIPENHETLATADFLAELYDATNLHGYSIKFKDVGLFGCGAANSGLSKMSDKEVYDVLKRSFNYIKDTRKKIMVTHVHPQGSNIEKFSTIVKGSGGVTKAIKQLKPDLLLCGHVHEAAGIEEKIGSTRIINVGREGTILEF